MSKAKLVLSVTKVFSTFLLVLLLVTSVHFWERQIEILDMIVPSLFSFQICHRVYVMYFKTLFFRCFKIHDYDLLIILPLYGYKFSCFISLTLFWNVLSYLCSHCNECDKSFSITLLLFGQTLKSYDFFLPSLLPPPTHSFLSSLILI